MAFWWTGRGYLALPTTIGTVGAFGALVTFAFGDSIFDRLSWLWGIAYALAAAATWWLGSRINRRPVRVTRSTIWKTRLFYRAPHRFCGLPVETWVLPLAVLGLVMTAYGVTAG